MIHIRLFVKFRALFVDFGKREFQASVRLDPFEWVEEPFTSEGQLPAKARKIFGWRGVSLHVWK